MRRTAPIPVVARLALCTGIALAAATVEAQPRRRHHRGVPPSTQAAPATEANTTPPTSAPEAPGAPAEAAPSAEVLEVARSLFREGVEAAQAGRWEEARQRFARVLSLRAAPLVRFNLAVASRNVGRFVEAIDQYRQFVRDIPAGSDPARERAARDEVTQLEARRAFVRVQVSGDAAARFVLDGRTLPASLLGEEIPVDPGPHTVDVEGRAGDRQRREGTLYEAEHVTVDVALSPTPQGAPGGAGAQRATVQAQPFGHWVARPGRDGRWVDWARQATREAPSVWAERPWTVGLQVGALDDAAYVGVTARWFPQPWAGMELALGTSRAVDQSGAALVHLRLPLRRVALGVYGGPVLGRARHWLCSSEDCAGSNIDPVQTTTLAGASVGASAEWRFTRTLSARVLAGALVVGNARDVGGGLTPTERPGCGGAELACAAFRGDATTYTAATLSLDLGWSF